MATCPSCGRDPGLNTICPHCGADLKRRANLRTYGLIAVAVAAVGLGVLWFFATRSPIATVKIADIQATSNYAYVQINGVVTRGPNYNPTAQSLTFWVRDDTGEIMVSSFRDVTQELIAADQVPAPGDTVSLQGTLRVREDQPSLTLDSAGALSLEPGTINAPLRDIGSIQLSDALHGVAVHGAVRSINAPFDGLQLITLRDATGAIDLALPIDLAPLIGTPPPLTIGQSIEVVGVVTTYGTSPQLSIRRGRDVRVLPENVEFARPMRLAAVSDSQAGRWVHVQAEIGDVTQFTAGRRITLIDGDARLTVVVWQDVWDQLPAQARVIPGATLAVSGEVNVFRGELELIPEQVIDLAVVKPAAVAPTPTATPTAEPTLAPLSAPTETPAAPIESVTSEATRAPAVTAAPTTPPTRAAAASPTPGSTPAAVVPIGSLTNDHVGQVFAVRAKVVETSSFSAGFKFLLDDGTGRISLTIFDSDYRFVPNRAGLNLGAEVLAQGKVAVFQGVLELQPNAGRDVTILSAGSSANVPVSPINQLTKPGLFVAVEGTITEVRPFSSGTNLTVDDGTGTIRVTLFDNVLAYVPNRSGLATGVKVRVVGKTDFFGRMQVVPALGYDVTIR